MARNQRRPEAASEIRLEPQGALCEACGERSWVAYHGTRTVTTLEGPVRLRLAVRPDLKARFVTHHLLRLARTYAVRRFRRRSRRLAK